MNTVAAVKVGLRRRPEPNPVLVRELRARFRSKRAFLTVTAFVAVLAVAGLTVYASHVESNQSSFRTRSMGEPLVSTLMFVELLLATLIAPALTMNAISGERDRRTFELLLATPLSGWAILRGKFLASFAYILMLAFAVLPVMSLGFVFGGVSAMQVIGAQVVVIVSSVQLLMIGLFWSSWLKSSGRSAVATYASIALGAVGPFILFYFALFIVDGVMGGMVDLEKYIIFLYRLLPMGGGPVSYLFGSSPFISMQVTAPSWWLLFAVPPILGSAVLYVLAGLRIRPGGAYPKLAVIGLVWAWLIWVMWAWGQV